MSENLPSPFTVSSMEDQGFQWADEVSPPPPPRQNYTVGNLLSDLRHFGETYQRDADQIRQHDQISQRHDWIQLGAFVSDARASLSRIPGFEELRTFAVANWGEEITIPVCRRILGALVQRSNGTLSVADVENMTLAEAASRLSQANESDASDQAQQLWAASAAVEEKAPTTAQACSSSEQTDVFICPDCGSPLPDKYRTLSKVDCPTCGQQTCHTGKRRLPVAGPGHPPAIVNLYETFWEPVPPAPPPAMPAQPQVAAEREEDAEQPCSDTPLAVKGDQSESRASRPDALEKFKPGYPKPPVERLVFAGKQLAEIEQYIAPQSAVLASLLVRALLARTCTTAEAMWAIFGQIQTGRYKATPMDDLPNTIKYLVSEHGPPAGLNVASGVLHIDGEAGDWGRLVITLPKRNNEPTEERGTAMGEKSLDNSPANEAPVTQRGRRRSKETAEVYKACYEGLAKKDRKDLLVLKSVQEGFGNTRAPKDVPNLYEYARRWAKRDPSNRPWPLPTD